MSGPIVHKAESSLCLRGDVIAVSTLKRDPEFNKIFSIVIEDLAGRERYLAFKQDANRIPVVFHGEWADACSFIATGDVVEVHNFTVDTYNVSPTNPFVAIINATSEVTVHRTRLLLINAANVASFHFEEEASTQSQAFQNLLIRGHNMFTKMGGFYDAVFGQRDSKPRFDFVMSILHGYYVRTVLDCGCGTGLFAFYLQEYGISVTGLDASETLLEVAKQKNTFMAEGRQVPFHVKDMADFRLLQDNPEGEGRPQQFDCVICMDALQYLPDMNRVRLAIRAFWYHVRADGHLVLDLPNPRAQTEAQAQTVMKYPLQRRDLTALGSPLLLDEGTLDVVQRATVERGAFRVHEWFGFAQQYDKSKKAKYFINWMERFDELLFNPEELEMVLEEEGFHIVAIYGDQTGGEFDPHTSSRRYYVCARRFLGSPEEGE